MAFVIAEPCRGVKDGACVDVCPVDCIRSDKEQAQYFIDPATCIDCHACATVCPVGAIFYEADVPERWQQATADNARYFHATGIQGAA